jgi:hypothetical protein
MKETLSRLRVLNVKFEEVNGKCVLTKDQLLRIVRQYCELLALSQRLLEKHQRIEFLLEEYRLKKSGMKKADHYIN